MMPEKFPNTRTESPAYLARYLNRKKSKADKKLENR